ncbi:YceI family protein [Mangrovicoccus algicola]|uniref:Polyisoprenoid-binding protein n=1 Tax=Mangrovicoccus algicola TaxID=2771008 RepID=A0A8J6Z9M7_9RHOB|nr:YceI family protein [Mangrovicoccus algicola]MBE3640614.1 polyisoprenoid-binding protein [Mangrovicoccus algicola]
MSKLLLASALTALTATGAMAAETYAIDTTHAQIVYHYNHLGFSTTYGMFSGITGEIQFDEADPAASSVSVSFPVSSLATGDDERTAHFQTEDFFGAEANPEATFTSTSIEVTGETSAEITGDLTVNGITKSVVLDTTMTQKGDHPMAGKPWIGFTATTTLTRSDFDMGMYAPYVGDEVEVFISVEAMDASAE